MKSNIEKEFIKIFDINPINFAERGAVDFTNTIEIDGKRYPEVTDHILLELICIYNSTYINGFTNYSILSSRSIDGIKEEILKNCLKVKDEIILKVQQLFQEDL